MRREDEVRLPDAGPRGRGLSRLGRVALGPAQCELGQLAFEGLKDRALQQ